MFLLSKLGNRYQVTPLRSPCRSHPTTLPIKQQLAAIKTAIATSNPTEDTICSCLSQLAKLYISMSEVLSSSTTRDLISVHNKKWAEELLKESVKFLDVCGSIRDMVTQFKEHIRDVHFALRRRKFDLRCENKIKKYNCFRKKMKKDAKLLIAGLKQHDNNNMITCDESVVVDSDDHQFAAAMREVVIEVNETTVSIFESLLHYVCMPISKPNRWSIFVSNLIHKGRVACEDHLEHGIMNEFESIDELLQTLCKNESSAKEEVMQKVKCRLEKQESHLDCMETRLECIFKHLIRSRASMLNIISQYKPSELLHSQQCYYNNKMLLSIRWLEPSFKTAHHSRLVIGSIRSPKIKRQFCFVRITFEVLYP